MPTRRTQSGWPAAASGRAARSWQTGGQAPQDCGRPGGGGGQAGGVPPSSAAAAAQPLPFPAARPAHSQRPLGLPGPSASGCGAAACHAAAMAQPAAPAALAQLRPATWRAPHCCRWRRGGRLSSRLMHDLQRRTALACSLCDPGGEAPFQRREHLLRHMQEAHDQRLCSLCLQVGRPAGGRIGLVGGQQALQCGWGGWRLCNVSGLLSWQGPAVTGLHLHLFSKHSALPLSRGFAGAVASLQRPARGRVHLCARPPPRPPPWPVQEGRLFPLELEPFPSLEALQAHTVASHPHCDFCRRTFYDSDALWKHMHQVLTAGSAGRRAALCTRRFPTNQLGLSAAQTRALAAAPPFPALPRPRPALMGFPPALRCLQGICFPPPRLRRLQAAPLSPLLPFPS